MSGTVIALMLQKSKGEPFWEAQSLILDEEMGIRQDCHYGSKGGQVSILDEGCRRWIEDEKRDGLCLGRFQANLLLGGFAPEEWKEGERLKIGEVILELKKRGKNCFPECKRMQEGRACRLKKSCCFAAVRRGGQIRRGDAWVMMPADSADIDRENKGKR